MPCKLQNKQNYYNYIHILFRRFEISAKFLYTTSLKYPFFASKNPEKSCVCTFILRDYHYLFKYSEILFLVVPCLIWSKKQLPHHHRPRHTHSRSEPERRGQAVLCQRPKRQICPHAHAVQQHRVNA